MDLGQLQIGDLLSPSRSYSHTSEGLINDTQALRRHLGCRWMVAVVFVVKVAHKSPKGAFVVANCSVVVVEVQKHHYWGPRKEQSHHIVRGL
jgi:hypothetical protein